MQMIDLGSVFADKAMVMRALERYKGKYAKVLGDADKAAQSIDNFFNKIAPQLHEAENEIEAEGQGVARLRMNKKTYAILEAVTQTTFCGMTCGFEFSEYSAHFDGVPLEVDDQLEDGEMKLDKCTKEESQKIKLQYDVSARNIEKIEKIVLGKLRSEFRKLQDDGNKAKAIRAEPGLYGRLRTAASCYGGAGGAFLGLRVQDDVLQMLADQTSVKKMYWVDILPDESLGEGEVQIDEEAM